ncbi:hypothetical protein D3C80_1855160 [compost metagenome]
MQHARDQQHLLPHPLGIGGNPHIESLLQIKQPHQPLCLLLGIGPLHPVELADKTQVFFGGQAIVQFGNLRNITDPSFVSSITV